LKGGARSALHEKRYQVFISSTFEDLREERRAVQDVVISTGDFPVQMESFPAADEDQFGFIRALIDNCDYYVLIIAGRYGTAAEDGLSYTHKEFRYAVQQGVPVLVMLHANPGSIPADKTEQSEHSRRLLTDFIREASAGRLRKEWRNIDDLKLRVREALDNAKATKPRVGWVRGDAIASIEALEQLNAVRKQNAEYRDALGDLEVEIRLPQLPLIEARVEIALLPNRDAYAVSALPARVETSWLSMFPVLQGNLKWDVERFGDDEYWIDRKATCIAIGSATAQELSAVDVSAAYRVSEGDLDKLVAYYIEAGLMLPEGNRRPFTELAEKLARRSRFSETRAPGFVVISGKVQISNTDSTAARGALDDEIPF
jgi:hypothetical protein